MLLNEPYHHDLVENHLFDEEQQLEIIANPCCTSKLRYRSEYEMNKTRRGVLHSRNDTNYQSPTIRVSLFFSDRLFSFLFLLLRNNDFYF